MPDTSTSATDLQKVAERSLFFGHQSVGGNILAGVEQILAGQSGVGPRLVMSDDPAAAGRGIWVHANIGENEDPAGKIADFVRRLEGGFGDRVDVAFFKLCYVDFSATTDVRALFDSYDRALTALAAKYPRTTFVHVTAPLTTVQTGLKAAAKRALGRPVWGEQENARRQEYNDLLRRRFAHAPVFDLAELEATSPTGQASTFESGGRRLQVLLPAYTSDGGHLNAAGQRLVADRLLHFLAQLPLAPTPAGEAP